MYDMCIHTYIYIHICIYIYIIANKEYAHELGAGAAARVATNIKRAALRRNLNA